MPLDLGYIHKSKKICQICHTVLRHIASMLRAFMFIRQSCTRTLPITNNRLK